ncbi:MAG: hypothetical protein K6G89_06355 [Clostridia bacterium]|nr:hypothetical protein [Clostridia bacterium]
MENEKAYYSWKLSKFKVLLFLFSTLFFCLLSACSCATETKPSFDEGFPGSFTEDFSKANYWQDNVVYLMHVYKEALFLYDGSTVSIFKDNELSVFEDLSNYNTDDKFISGLCFFNKGVRTFF